MTGGLRARQRLTSTRRGALALTATLVAVVLSLALPATAGAATAATLAGRVVASGGASVAGAKVTVFSAVYGTVLGTATADWTGTYSVPNLPAGSVRARFDDPSGTWESRFDGGAATFAAAPNLVLTAGATTTANVVLPPKAIIAGLARNRFGTPVANVTVTAFSSAYGAVMGTAVTDSAGTYSIGRLPTSTFRVRFSDPNGNVATSWNGGALTFSSAADISATAGATTTVNATVGPNGSISTSTITATGLPLKNMTIAVSLANTIDIVTSKSETAAGNSASFPVAPGTFKVFAFDPSATATTGYRPTFNGGYIVGDPATGFAGSPTVAVTESTTTNLPPLRMVPMRCDPAVYGDGADLAGAALTGADLSYCILSNASFNGATLTNADLHAATFAGANFSGANLLGANVAGAVLSGATWSLTTCPDGYVTAASGDSCLAHLGTSSTFTVTSTADEVDSTIGDNLCWSDVAQGCTLRAAVQENNAHPDHTIALALGAYYNLTRVGPNEDLGASGDLDITGNLTLAANGDGINGSGSDRVLQVFAGANVHVNDATITGGGAPGDGGGISNAGTLTLSYTNVSYNFAGGGGTNNATGNGTDARRGGGIFNSGTLTIDHSTISFNTMGAGGPALLGTSGPGGTSGAGGDGGGIYSSGSLTVTASVIDHNTASQGGASWGGPNGTTAGHGGRGGGLFNGGIASITDSTISNNHAGAGGDGLTGTSTGGGPNTAGPGGNGGSGGEGGGVYTSLGIIVRSSTIRDNVAGAGGRGGDGGHDFLSPNGGNGGNGGSGGNAGGVYAVHTSTFTNATIGRNSPGAAGAGGVGGAPGGESGVGTGTYGLPGSAGAVGNIGGLDVVLGTSTIDYSTIARNTGLGATTVSNLGAFLATVNVADTIVSDGTNGKNCGGGTITSGGYNIDSGTSCGFASTGDRVSTSPILGALQVNGSGPVTFLPAAGSLAINAIPSGTNRCGTTIVSDERGVTRPTGGSCDVGAVEQ